MKTFYYAACYLSRYLFGLTAILAVSLWFAAIVLAMPRNLADLRAIPDRLINTGLIHGDIPSLNSPQFWSMREGLMSLEPGDQVFVVPLPDGIRIYPQKIMVWHGVVNEIIMGAPYCITYCPISGCMAVYKSSVQRQNLIIDMEGRLYNNNSVLIDRNTGSLWSQLLGMGFDGPLIGAGMNIMPAYWTTWRFAKEAFPNAKVLATPRGGWRNYGRDPYGSYVTPGNYYDDERILYPLTYLDSRFSAKTRIIGLEVERNLIAIDINYVREKKIVNFYAGLTPLVAIFDSRMDVARIFNRDVWEGRTPALFAIQDGYIKDIQTRSIWNMDGNCVTGNLQGARLEELFGIYAFWFAWASFHPETESVPGATVVPDSALFMGEAIQ